jgi:phenylalanine-4-hydroxylase
MSDFEHVFEKPPEGAAADWTIPQNWAAYTEVEHRTWDTLYARQMKILPGRACDAFLRGLDALDLNAGGIPDFDVINPKLQALTGWGWCRTRSFSITSPTAASSRVSSSGNRTSWITCRSPTSSTTSSVMCPC